MLDCVPELTRAAPVTSERRTGLADLGRRLFDELGDMPVSLAPARARLKIVGNVANEDVFERPLHVSFDPRHRVTVDEITPLESRERLPETIGVASDPHERALPEDPAADAGVQDYLALVGRQGVQASGYEPSDRRRQGFRRFESTLA